MRNTQDCAGPWPTASLGGVNSSDNHGRQDDTVPARAVVGVDGVLPVVRRREQEARRRGSTAGPGKGRSGGNRTTRKGQGDIHGRRRANRGRWMGGARGCLGCDGGDERREGGAWRLVSVRKRGVCTQPTQVGEGEIRRQRGGRRRFDRGDGVGQEDVAAAPVGPAAERVERGGQT